MLFEKWNRLFYVIKCDWTLQSKIVTLADAFCDSYGLHMDWACIALSTELKWLQTCISGFRVRVFSRWIIDAGFKKNFFIVCKVFGPDVPKWIKTPSDEMFMILHNQDVATT